MFFTIHVNLKFQLPILISLIFSVLIALGFFPNPHNTTLCQGNYPSYAVPFSLTKKHFIGKDGSCYFEIKL